MKLKLAMKSLAIFFIIVSLTLTGCLFDRGSVQSVITAQAGGTNVLTTTLETPEGNKLSVTGAQTLEINDHGVLSMKGLATGSYLTNLAHKRTSFMGGSSDSGVQGRSGDPDEAVVGAAGTALGNVIKTVVTP